MKNLEVPMASFVCDCCGEQRKGWDYAEPDSFSYPELEGKNFCLDCIEEVETEVRLQRDFDRTYNKRSDDDG